MHFGNWVVGLNGTKMPENYFFSTCRQAPFPSDDHLAPYSLARWNTAALPWGPATLPKWTVPLLRSVYLSHSFLYFYPISLFIYLFLDVICLYLDSFVYSPLHMFIILFYNPNFNVTQIHSLCKFN